MTDKNFDVVDREYGEIPRKGSARQIKTRSTSFEKIRNFFNKIRLERLKKKLDQKVEQALTQGYKMDNYEKKLTKNANVIARLEEKIMVLSGETVPTNYVSRRAIKLRESMASNLTYNSGLMYSVGLENRDAVLNSGIAEEEPIEVPEVPVVDTTVEEEKQEVSNEDNVVEMPTDSVLAAAAPSEEESSKIDVVPSDLERKEIEDVINSNFEGIKDAEASAETPVTESHEEVPTEQPVVDGEMSSVDKDEVREVVNEAFDAMKGEDVSIDDMPPLGREDIQGAIEEAFVAKSDDMPPLGREDVQGAVEEAFEAVDTDVKETASLAREDVQGAVEEAFEAVDKVDVEIPVVEEAPVVEAEIVDKATETDIDHEVDKAIERIRVSRNNSSAVNASQYDEDGNRRERRRKYNYVPMTDEEIRQSQIKLGFDEHGNIIDNGAQKPKEEVISRARIIGNFIAPNVIPNISINDVFIPADPTPEKQMREIPVVAPSRDEVSLDLDIDDDKSLFDIIENPSDETEEEYHVAEPAIGLETASQSSGEMSIDDYNALKQKILYLQQQKKLTNQQKLDAQKAAEVAGAEARAARRLYEISQENYNKRIQRLIAYTEALEADCDENVRSAAQAEDDAKKSSDYAQAQRELVDENNRIIGEIDSMIGSEEDQDTVAKGR